MVAEANYIAKALEKNVTFFLTAMVINGDWKLVIHVDNKDVNMSY